MTEPPRELAPCAPSPSAPPAQAMFPARPESSAQARAYVREVLARDDEPLVEAKRDDVLLIVAELVTNAYRYGTEPDEKLLVAVLTTPKLVRIEVHDPRRRRPHMRNESGARARGRGLHIVDALAARWNVDDRPFGKAVWAEVDR